MNAMSKSRENAGVQTLEGGLEFTDRPVGLKQALAHSTHKMPVFTLPDSSSATEAEKKAYWQLLRAFFRSGKGGWPAGQAFESALLAPYREEGALDSGFPLWMPDGDTWLKSGSTEAVQPLEATELIARAVLEFAPGEDDSRTLKHQLPRLNRIVVLKANAQPRPVSAPDFWKSTTEELQKELQLKGVEALLLTGELNQLLKQLPQGGVIVPFATFTPLYLLAATLEFQVGSRTEAVNAWLESVLPRLRDALEIEKGKQPQSSSPEQLRQGMDFAERFVNFEALSGILPTAGEGTATPRYARLVKALSALESLSGNIHKLSARFVMPTGFAEEKGIDLAKLMPKADVLSVAPSELFSTAHALFEQTMSESAAFFAALRTAALELDNHYQEEAHDDFFAHFDWKAFTAAELSVCTPVILLTTTDELMGRGLSSLSASLSSNLPIRIVALTGLDAGLSDKAYQLEPVSFSIAHRNSFVLQASAVAPGALLRGMQQGLQRLAPAVFNLVCMPGAAKKGYMETLSALESRTFPGISYDPAKGSHWGSRFDLLQNPDSDQDWPVHTVHFRKGKNKAESTDASLTYADFVCGHKKFDTYFHIVPEEYWTNSLVTLQEYLSLSPGARGSKVPYIWVAEKSGSVHRAAVAAPLAEIAGQRLDFWKHLQENAGIHSYHAERAAEKLAVEMESDFHSRMNQVKGDYQSELNRVKEEAARDAMAKLAAVLLDLDVASVGTSSAAASVVAPAPMETTTAETPAVAAHVDPEPKAEPVAKPVAAGPVEIAAWIDTPLCTSCGECVDSEPSIFAYNEEKMAIVVNPRGGSFADLVKSAERCPVSIIHPGTPWDKEDPDLAELLERAKPFE